MAKEKPDKPQDKPKLNADDGGTARGDIRDNARR